MLRVEELRTEMMAVSRVFYLDEFSLRNATKIKKYIAKLEGIREKVECECSDGIEERKLKLVLDKAISYMKGTHTLKREAFMSWLGGGLSDDDALEVLER